MIEQINKTTLIRNFVISLFFGVILPYILFMLVDPEQSIFDFNLIISNGIIFIIVYTSFGLFKKETFIRLVIGSAYLIIIYYFYLIGSNIYTMYLPHCSFATICIGGSFAELSITFTFDYSFMAILFIIIKSLNLIRHYIKPIKEEEEDEGDVY